jgi:hypothetical protein
VLFNDTIMHNIRYGRLGASDGEVKEAAAAAAIHQAISERFPKVGPMGAAGLVRCCPARAGAGAACALAPAPAACACRLAGSLRSSSRCCTPALQMLAL